MGIYINMKMPEGELGAVPVIIFADGAVRHYFSHVKLGEAVPVPPHGRLIDADALGEFPYNMDFCDGYEADEWVRNAPTIIPAEGVKT